MEQRPKTIEELKGWYIARNLPSENVTRFFIGKNYTGAKAFGIYKDEITGNYIVYKNKADGARSIRYNGENEAFAVNELYKKLKEEIHNQKNNNPKNYNNEDNPIRYANNDYSKYNSAYNSKYKGKNIKLIRPLTIIIIYLLIILVPFIITINKPKRGYYNYNDKYYYYQEGSWYTYNDYGYWHSTDAPETLSKNHSNYYDSTYYSSSYGTTDFENSGYYKEPKASSSSSSDYDYDYDYDWDSGSSWDSDYTDWDSDW